MVHPSPVVAGVGQAANKDDERIVHPIELIEAAARSALADAGVAASRIGAIFATPLSTYSRENPTELLADRLAIGPGLRAVSSYSGAAPQKLMAQACEAVATGTVEAALIIGGIGDASVRRALRRGIEPPAPPTSRWSQGTSGRATEGLVRTMGGGYPRYVPEIAAGADLPNAYFALVESALAAGLSVDQHRAALGELLAPFTHVAAAHPDLAWFPTPRTPDELSRPTADNRMVAEPYTKLMCSFPTVDLAAAVVITAARPGRAQDVRPLALVSGRESTPPSGRPDLGRSPMLERLVDEAQALSGVEVGAIAQFDLYSCFPAAVQLASAALGLAPDDPRPRTSTGGLPYFGGPGASYSLHGIACLVDDLRRRPGSVAGAVSLGGMVTDFSVGFYTTGDGEVRTLDVGTSSATPVETVTAAAGRATVDAATVLHARDSGAVAAPVVARLADGRRIGAKAGDPALPAALAGRQSLVNREVILTTAQDGTVTYLPA